MIDRDAWRRRQAQWRRFNRWEDQQLRKATWSRHEAFRLFDALHHFVGTLGDRRRLAAREDLEAELRMAAILNTWPRGG